MLVAVVIFRHMLACLDLEVQVQEELHIHQVLLLVAVRYILLVAHQIDVEHLDSKDLRQLKLGQELVLEQVLGKHQFVADHRVGSLAVVVVRKIASLHREQARGQTDMDCLHKGMADLAQTYCYTVLDLIDNHRANKVQIVAVVEACRIEVAEVDME